MMTTTTTASATGADICCTAGVACEVEPPIGRQAVCEPAIGRASSPLDIVPWSQSCKTVMADAEVVVPCSCLRVDVAESSEVVVLVVPEIAFVIVGGAVFDTETARSQTTVPKTCIV